MTDVHLSLAERLEAVAQGFYWSDKALHEADEGLEAVASRIIAARQAIGAALTGQRVDSFALSDAAALLAALDGGRSLAALKAENEALREALKELISWIPTADVYRRLGFDPETPMQALKKAKAALKKEG